MGFFNRDLGKTIVAAFHAYFDASGSERGSDPLVLTGVIATVEKWHKFDEAWTTHLDRYGVEYLHMKEFAFSRGQFSGWENDQPRRKKFLEGAVATIKNQTNKLIALHVSIADYSTVNKRFDLDNGTGGGAFPLLADTSLSVVRRWVIRVHPGSGLAPIFEQGDSGLGRYIEMVRQKRGTPPIMAPKYREDLGGWLTPFQACDFVSYEVAKRIKDGSKRSMRGSLESILRQLPLEIRGLTADSLESIAAKSPEMFPRRKSE